MSSKVRLALAALGLAAGTGCAPTSKQGASGDSDWRDSGPPSISALTWSCDSGAATWKFQVDTAGWTGGGALWMAEDATRVERHGLSSVSAASDGSTDRLTTSLSVVADWRYAVEGSSTVWRCAEQEQISFLAVVYTRDGADRADCRTWGANPGLWDTLEDVPDCATVLPDTGDTGA